MRYRRNRAHALVVAVVLLLAPLPGRADGGDPDPGTLGWGNVFRYAGCALAIGGAHGPAQLVGTLLGCLTLIKFDTH
jgi:hypothetical protein